MQQTHTLHALPSGGPPLLLLLLCLTALCVALAAYRRSGRALVEARRASREQIVFALREAALQEAALQEAARRAADAPTGDAA